MGAAAVAGGFVIILFIALIGFILFIGLWVFRRWYLRRHHASKGILFIVNCAMVITISPAAMMISAFVSIKIDDYSTEKQRMEQMAIRYQQLKEPLSFGEMMIPRDSWINLDIPMQLPLEDLEDIRQGISSMRFSETIYINEIPVAAIDIGSRGILLEMAKDTDYQISGETKRCPQGWVLRLLYPEGYQIKMQYQDLSGSWFTPSLWEIDRCFQTTGAVAVLAINQQGVYVLKSTPISKDEE